MENSKRGKGRGTIVDSNEEDLDIQNKEMIVEKPIPIPSSETKPRTRSASKSEKKSKKQKEEDKEKLAFELLSWMRELYKNDLQSNKQMKPATDKIQNIDQVVSKIIRKDMQEPLIEMGILKELKIWLEPLPDKTMPNIKIKRSILDLLSNLKITKNDLLNSGIGKIIHFYSKNSKEAIDIRKRATQLVKKWKSQILREEAEED